jgi:WD40 repeat protein
VPDSVTSTESKSPSSPSPESTESAVAWQVQVDGPTNPPNWPEQIGLSIPVPAQGDRVILPATPSPFVALGLKITGGDDVQLWNLLTGQKAGQIQEAVKARSEFSLSPDGSQLAVKSDDSKHYSKIEIWSFQTGKMVHEIECDHPRKHLQTFQFVAPGRLFAYSYGSIGQGTTYLLRVFDTMERKRLAEIELDTSYTKDRFVVSPGGRYVAALAHNNDLSVFDVIDGKVVGQVEIKQFLENRTGAYRGMSYSPDGKQLGIVYSSTNSLLLLLDMEKGEPADQVEIAGKPPTASAYRGAAVEWLGAKGWCLFGGSVIDRNTRRVVWNLELPIVDRLTARRTLPGGWIAQSGPYAKKTIQFVPIPWPQIEAGLTAIQGKSPARLRPGGSVSLNFDIGQLRFGTKEDTTARLSEIYKERFRADDITIADGQPIVLNVRYSESEGETMYERRGIMGPKTGRTVQATNAQIAMTLATSDGSQTFWTHEIAYDPRSVTVRAKEANEANVRDSIFRQFLFTLSETPIPYFVPQDAGASQLPGVTKLDGGQ